MAVASFFGHRDYYYYDYRDKINFIVTDLIENHGVTLFYNGYRGNFDRLCASIVQALKKTYPFIENIMALSYIPNPNFDLPLSFDGSVYLLDKPILPKFAIYYTNREMVKISDFIISGVQYDYGGAYTACEYARKLKKPIINIFGDR